MITVKDVENIAVLARLEISEADKAVYQKELSSILQLVEQINKVDLKSIEPTSHILNLNNVTREDKVQEPLPLEKILSNAPQQKDGSIVVPKVL